MSERSGHLLAPSTASWDLFSPSVYSPPLCWEWKRSCAHFMNAWTEAQRRQGSCPSLLGFQGHSQASVVPICNLLLHPRQRMALARSPRLGGGLYVLGGKWWLTLGLCGHGRDRPHLDNQIFSVQLGNSALLPLETDKSTRVIWQTSTVIWMGWYFQVTGRNQPYQNYYRSLTCKRSGRRGEKSPAAGGYQGGVSCISHPLHQAAQVDTHCSSQKRS